MTKTFHSLALKPQWDSWQRKGPLQLQIPLPHARTEAAARGGGLRVAILADSRESKPHTLPVAVLEQAPLSTGTTKDSQQRRGPPPAPR